MLIRPISLGARFCGAISLVLVAFYDWAISKTWGGTRDFPAGSISGNLVGQWVRGERSFAAVTRRIENVGCLELLILSVVHVTLAVLGLQAVVGQKMRAHPQPTESDLDRTASLIRRDIATTREAVMSQV
jgi:hypothetical protein